MEDAAECDLLEAWFTPIAEMIGESEDEELEIATEKEDFIEKTRNPYSENGLFQARVGTETQNALQQIFDQIHVISGGITVLTLVSAENPHFHQRENRLFPEAVFNWLLPYLASLKSGLSLIETQAKNREAKISSLATANKVLNQLLKSKEEMFDSVSEELYLLMMEKSQVRTMDCYIETEEDDLPVESCILNPSRLLGKTTQFPIEPSDLIDDKFENVAAKRRKLVKILGRDSTRRSESLRTSLHHWKTVSKSVHSGVVFGSFGNSGSLEGNYKLKIRLNNPLDRFIGSGLNPLPSPYLFSHLFSILDQYRGCIDQVPFPSLPEFLIHNLPYKSPLSKYLNSLQIYYTGESDCAVVFSRLFQLFDQDPLLPNPCKELVRLNAELKYLIEKSASGSTTIKDMESGGFLSVSETLKFAFSRTFSNDSKLIKQFLDAIRPEEVSEMDWGKLVLGLLMQERGLNFPPRKDSKSLPPDPFQALVPFLTDSGSNLDTDFEGLGEDLAGTGNLLEVSRGEILACLLQVYDLYIDQLYVWAESIGPSDTLSLSDFDRFCKEIDPGINSKAISSVWKDAVSLESRESNSVGKEAALLAIMKSDWPTLASKPLLPIVQKPNFRPVLTVQTEFGEDNEEQDLGYCVTLGSSRGQRNWPLFTPKGRQSVRRHRHTLSLPHDPFPF